MNEPSAIDAQLAGALPALLWLPVAVGATYGPVVWVDGCQRPDIDELTRRLTAIEKQLTQLGEFELQRVYGRNETRWIYAYGRYANAFFLSVDVKAGSFTRPDLTLQPYQSQFVVSFNLEDGATISLLRSIAASQSLLLHFDPYPNGSRHYLRSASMRGAETTVRAGFNSCGQVSPSDSVLIVSLVCRYSLSSGESGNDR